MKPQQRFKDVCPKTLIFLNRISSEYPNGVCVSHKLEKEFIEFKLSENIQYCFNTTCAVYTPTRWWTPIIGN